MELKLNRNDFAFVYRLKVVDYLKAKGIISILVARDKKSWEVFSLYLKDARFNSALREFEKAEAERLARIEFYEKRNKEFEKRER